MKIEKSGRGLGSCFCPAPDVSYNAVLERQQRATTQKLITVVMSLLDRSRKMLREAVLSSRNFPLASALFGTRKSAIPVYLLLVAKLPQHCTSLISCILPTSCLNANLTRKDASPQFLFCITYIMRSTKSIREFPQLVRLSLVSRRIFLKMVLSRRNRISSIFIKTLRVIHSLRQVFEFRSRCGWNLDV